MTRSEKELLISAIGSFLVAFFVEKYRSRSSARTTQTQTFVPTPTGTPRRYTGDPHDDANGHLTPRGTRYIPQRLGTFPRGKLFVWWAKRAFEQLGFTPEQATLLTAHVATETASGRDVTNYNYGNVRAFAGTRAPWHRTQSGRPWRSYTSAVDGLRGVLEVIRAPRYQRAYEALLEENPRWYYALALAGYTEPPGGGAHTPATAQDSFQSYNQILQAVRRWLRTPP